VDFLTAGERGEMLTPRTPPAFAISSDFLDHSFSHDSVRVQVQPALLLQRRLFTTTAANCA
jgi:hypothetical protein